MKHKSPSGTNSDNRRTGDQLRRGGSWRKPLALIAAASMLAIVPAGAIANAADPASQTPVAAATATTTKATKATAPTADKEYLKLTLTRTDDLGSGPVEVGSRLTWSLGYENLTTDTAFTVYPTESSMDGVITPQSSTNKAPVCRWSSLKPQQKAECKGTSTNTFTYHVVTKDDIAKGFTPTATVVASSDVNGVNVLQTVKITGETVKVNEPTVPDGKEHIKVTLKRTDSLGSTVKAGDKLTYEFTMTNLTDQQVVAYPSASNMTKVDEPSAPNASCRSVLQPNASGTCGFGYHVVTAEDVIGRSYTPKSTWRATKNREGTQVLQVDFDVNGETVTVEGPKADAASTPADRNDGTPIALATDKQIKDEWYRIPALAEAPNGWLLAAWDLRPTGGDAPGPNSIVQRISKDGGKSWETVRYVAQGYNVNDKTNRKYGYSDPSYVVDRETGKVFLFFVKSYDQGYFGSVQGVEDVRNVLQAVVVESGDNGQTWSEPRNITKDITKGRETQWKSRFASSGAGIQLRYGEHKGRLIQQYAVRTVGNANVAVSVYSDDHGKTWHAGNPVDGMNMDENKVVELSDGRVMLNSRPGAKGYRRVAISSDGGVNYTNLHDDKNLPDPNNNAQITRAFPDAPEGSAKAKILLYSSAGPDVRSNGLVRISFDDGTTWSAGKLFKSGYMAYSVITALSDAAGGGYGLFYEGAGMAYTHVSLAWLGYLTAAASGSATLTLDAGADKVGADGATVTVPVTVTNDADADYTSVTLTPSGLPSGWSAAPVTIGGGLKKGAKTTVDVAVKVPAGVTADTKATFVLKLTGRWAQSNDTLTGIADGTATVSVVAGSDPAPEPTEPTIASIGASLKAGDGKYVVGDTFAGVTVTAFMSDGTERELAADDVTVAGSYFGEGGDADLTKPFERAGEVQIVVRLKADPTKEDTFTVTVAEKTVTPDPEPNPGPSVPGLSDLTESNRVADLVPVDSMVAGGTVTLRVGSAHAGRVVVVFLDSAGVVRSRGNVTVGADGLVEAIAPEIAGSYRVAVSTAGGALLWDAVSVTAKSETPTPTPTPKPQPTPAPTAPSKRPAVADTGASVAVVAAVSVALLAAAGGVVFARRRA